VHALLSIDSARKKRERFSRQKYRVCQFLQGHGTSNTDGRIRGVSRRACYFQTVSRAKNDDDGGGDTLAAVASAKCNAFYVNDACYTDR